MKLPEACMLLVVILLSVSLHAQINPDAPTWNLREEYIQANNKDVLLSTPNPKVHQGVKEDEVEKMLLSDVLKSLSLQTLGMRHTMGGIRGFNVRADKPARPTILCVYRYDNTKTSGLGDLLYAVTSDNLDHHSNPSGFSSYPVNATNIKDGWDDKSYWYFSAHAHTPASQLDTLIRRVNNQRKNKRDMPGFLFPSGPTSDDYFNRILYSNKRFPGVATDISISVVATLSIGAYTGVEDVSIPGMGEYKSTRLFRNELAYDVAQQKEWFVNRDVDTLTFGVTSHRGYWRVAPENSIAAVEKAILFGAKITEIDLSRTKDGQIIVFHDPTLDRVSTGTGAVKDRTWDYIKTLALKDRFGNIFYKDRRDMSSTEQIPLLKDALLASKGRILLNLDKAELYLEEVWKIILETGTKDNVICKGYRSVQELKQVYGAKTDQMMSDLIWTPIVNDKIPADHNTSIEQFIKDFVDTKDTRGNPWAEAFELNPESFNTEALPYIKSIVHANGKRVGTFSAYADMGTGHAISQGRIKFDSPLEGRQSWDFLMDQDFDYIISDRVELLDDYIEDVGKEKIAEYDPPLPLGRKPSKKIALVSTHRAGNGEMGAENSLTAIANCIASGVSIIELDVCRSKDGVYFVFHDRFFEKMTNASEVLPARPHTFPNGEVFQYPIFNYTADEISKLKLRRREPRKSKCEPGKLGLNVTDENIPTLKEVLALIKGKIVVKIDKWDDVTYRTNNVIEICRLTEQTGTLANVLFGIKAPADDARTIFKEYAEKVNFMPSISTSTKANYVDSWLGASTLKSPIFKAQIACVRTGVEINGPQDCKSDQGCGRDATTLAFIQQLRNANKLIYIPATVYEQVANKDDTESTWSWAFQTEISGDIVETDNPTELIRFIRKNNLCQDELCPSLLKSNINLSRK